MAAGKEIKGRIKTVKNTAKITKAMELISTVKMKKAQDSVLSSRPFAIGALKIIKEFGDSFGESVFFKGPKNKTKKELLVVISSNKGLCGGYNVNIFKKVAQYLRDNKEKQFEFITVGKKSQEFIARTGGELISDFSEAIKDSVEVSDTKAISKEIVSLFTTGKYEKVVIFYSYYYSAITQKALAKQFLCIDKEDIVNYLTEIVGMDVEVGENVEHKIEPSKEEIINSVIPMILDMMFYEIILEAKASEHASRMVAMKNAKDSAGKKVFELTLTYNKARQANITKEISEIVSGVESMKD